MIRHMEAATGWQILVFRSAGIAVFLLIFLALRHRGRVVTVFTAAGWPAVLGGVCLGTTFSLNIFALLNATVANTVFLQSTQAIFGAMLGWLILGEPVRRGTWLAILFAMLGVGLMVVNSLSLGTLLGNVLALSGGLVMAGFAVSLRLRPQVDMLPAACLAGVFAALFACFMVPSFAVPLHDLLLCFAMGIVQLGIGFIVFTAGSRNVPAADLMLISLLEMILAPLWVWLFIAESPASLTMVGGTLVIGAVVAQALVGGRRAAQPTIGS